MDIIVLVLQFVCVCVCTSFHACEHLPCIFFLYLIYKCVCLSPVYDQLISSHVPQWISSSHTAHVNFENSDSTSAQVPSRHCVRYCLHSPSTISEKHWRPSCIKCFLFLPAMYNRNEVFYQWCVFSQFFVMPNIGCKNSSVSFFQQQLHKFLADISESEQVIKCAYFRCWMVARVLDI